MNLFIGNVCRPLRTRYQKVLAIVLHNTVFPLFIYLFIYLFFFLYRRSSAFISWSSNHVLCLEHWGTFCAGGHPNVIFVAATARTRIPTGSMQTTSIVVSTTSATLTPSYLSFLVILHEKKINFCNTTRENLLWIRTLCVLLLAAVRYL